jgi:hypothetical protein
MLLEAMHLGTSQGADDKGSRNELAFIKFHRYRPETSSSEFDRRYASGLCDHQLRSSTVGRSRILPWPNSFNGM